VSQGSPSLKLSRSSLPPDSTFRGQRTQDLGRPLGGKVSPAPHLPTLTLKGWLPSPGALPLLGLILHAWYQSVPAGSPHRRLRWHEYGGGEGSGQGPKDVRGGS
jgi:hypothetical protein